MNATAGKFKYNGIEYEKALSLDMSEMFFRLHDPAIARWNATDVITHFSVSPYSVMDNNPIVWADPTGADGESSNTSGISTSGNTITIDWNVVPENGSSVWFNNGYNHGFTMGFEETMSYFNDSHYTRLPGVYIGNNDHAHYKGAADLINNQIHNTRWYKSAYFESSGVAEDSWQRYAPVWGSGLDAYDAFARGDWWKGAGHTLLAISDVFLVKSIVTGLGKGGINALGKNYKNWSSYRSFYGKKGFAKPGQDVHHWLFEKGGKSGSGLWWKLKNQMWNLQPMKSMTFNGIKFNGTIIHQAMHGNSNILIMSPLQKAFSRIYQTPAWPWAIPSTINYINK